MQAQVGDRIMVESERAAQHCREGVVEEVIEAATMRMRVRWDDGRTSILTPKDGVARVVSAPATGP